VSIAVAFPFAGRFTLVGLMDHVGHCGLGHNGGGDVERVTVPEKLLMLRRSIVDFPVAPGASWSVAGKAWMLKLPLLVWKTLKVMLTEWDSGPFDPNIVAV